MRVTPGIYRITPILLIYIGRHIGQKKEWKKNKHINKSNNRVK